MTPLRIFLGWDPSETVAYATLAHAIIRRASIPVAIAPMARQHLVGLHDRPRGPLDSTDFATTRFLVPVLCGYEGLAVFMDCDMLVRCDVAELVNATGAEPGKAVWVAQHDYIPKAARKFLGQAQTTYPRKNWSSLIVWNTAECQALTPDYVNTAPGLDLHRFAWLPDDQIGSLPLTYNWLVGEYPANPDARILHFTNGGPWFRDYQDADHAEEWFAEFTHLRGHSAAMSHF